MYKNIYFYILLIFLYTFFANISIYTKNDDKGKKDQNINHQKSQNKDSQKNESILHERENKNRYYNESEQNDNISQNRSIKIQNNLLYFLKTSKSIEISIETIYKEIKKNQSNNEIKPQLKLEENIQYLFKEYENFKYVFNESETKQIKQQLQIIENSNTAIQEYINNLKNDKKVKNRLKYLQKMEKESNKVYRQFRAIEWILFEQ